MMKMKKQVLFLGMLAVMAVNFLIPGSVVKAASPSRVSDGLIFIKGGSFTMGSPKKERLRGKDEVSHKVTVSDFYISPYEVSQKDYKAVMGKNPSRHKGNNKPVENVTVFPLIL